MAADPFQSAEAKYKRALYHLDTFKEQVIRDTKFNFALSYTGRSRDFRQHWIGVKFMRPLPIETWCLMVSDCMQNFRSSLDHAIYGLNVKKLNQSPPPNEELLAFPICDKSESYASQHGKLGDARKGLGGDNIKKGIEALQPFNRPNGAKKPLLAQLRDFNDRDKHRLIPIMATGVQFTDFDILHAGGLTFSVETPPVELADYARVITLTFTRPAKHVEVVVKQLRVFGGLPTERLDGTIEAEAVDLFLERVRDEVRFALDSIKSLV
jgi:hypothetical protein